MTFKKSNTIPFIIAVSLLIAAALFRINWSPGEDVQMKVKSSWFKVQTSHISIGNRTMIAYHKDNPPSDVVRESVEHKVHHRFLIQLVQLLL